MNVSPDSTSYQKYDSGFVCKNVIAGVMLNEGDYHGVVVVGVRKSLAIRAVVRAIKWPCLQSNALDITATPLGAHYVIPFLHYVKHHGARPKEIVKH